MWGCCLNRLAYYLEVMKGGQIMETRPTAEKDHYTFGRSPGCDFLLEHPSASRLHAVLQFRGADGAAFLFDAASAHGTLLNKRRLKPRAHAPLRCLVHLDFFSHLWGLEGQGSAQVIPGNLRVVGLPCTDHTICGRAHDWPCEGGRAARAGSARSA
jgi:hypothetical protein